MATGKPTAAASDELTRPPGWPAHSWLIAMASLLEMTSTMAPTAAASVRSRPRMSGADTTHHAPKWARFQP